MIGNVSFMQEFLCSKGIQDWAGHVTEISSRTGPAFEPDFEVNLMVREGLVAVKKMVFLTQPIFAFVVYLVSNVY